MITAALEMPEPDPSSDISSEALIRPQDHRSNDTPHAYLRAETRLWHAEVEEGFAPFNLCEVAGLRQFLLRQVAAVLPIERELEARGVQVLLPDWPDRRRVPALLADFATLGVDPPTATLRARLPSRAQQLGALYVLEGSRLGGRILHRQSMASSNALVRSAQAYLDHSGPRQGWSLFLQLLNQCVLTDDVRRGLRAGAEQAFGLFKAAASSSELTANSF